MCGIYGRIGPRNDTLDAQATAMILHRGPDDVGLYVDPRGDGTHAVALGQTRLSIIDLSDAGHQPMLSDDGDIALVFNGEIFNYATLRAELVAQGVRFHSQCDTEVILRLYEREGDAMLSRLAGMFAIGVWDRRERRLLLARDRGGIKPLYYRADALDPSAGGSGPVAFASEPKCLLVDPNLRREPDLDALVGYLAYLYVPPPRSAFRGISQLPAGHKLVVDAAGTHITPYAQFRMRPKHQFRDLDHAVDEAETLLREVIAEHMVGDVPIGAFLSGGIDSALIVALVAQFKRERGDKEQLKTFTVGFSDQPVGDESEAARRIADTVGVEHRVIRASGSLARERFSHVVDQFDEPFANPTTLLHDLLCEGAREEVTVALAGSGGDEAFGGYPRHRATLLFGAARHLPNVLRRDLAGAIAGQIPDRADAAPTLRRVRRLLSNLAGDFPRVYRGWLTHYPAGELAGLLATRSLLGGHGEDPGNIEAAMARTAELGGSSLLDSALLADVLGFMPDNVLRDADRMSMRHALEVRVPFADHRVLDFGLRLPDSYRVAPMAGLLGRPPMDSSKRVLRHLAARVLPDWVSAAPKQGFVAPLGSWMKTELKATVDQATHPDTLLARGLVRPEVVATMVQEHHAGKRDRTWNLWALVVLEDWFKRRIDTLAVTVPDVSHVQPVVADAG